MGMYKKLLDVNLEVIRYSDDMEFVYINGMYAPDDIRDAVLRYAKEKEKMAGKLK